MDNYDYLEGCLPIRQIIIIHSKFSTLNILTLQLLINYRF